MLLSDFCIALGVSIVLIVSGLWLFFLGSGGGVMAMLSLGWGLILLFSVMTIMMRAHGQPSHSIPHSKGALSQSLDALSPHAHQNGFRLFPSGILVLWGVSLVLSYAVFLVVSDQIWEHHLWMVMRGLIAVSLFFYAQSFVQLRGINPYAFGAVSVLLCAAFVAHIDMVVVPDFWILLLSALPSGILSVYFVRSFLSIRGQRRFYSLPAICVSCALVFIIPAGVGFEHLILDAMVWMGFLLCGLCSGALYKPDRKQIRLVS